MTRAHRALSVPLCLLPSFPRLCVTLDCPPSTLHPSTLVPRLSVAPRVARHTDVRDAAHELTKPRLSSYVRSPGWSRQEAHALRVCLKKFGVGRWVSIVDSGVLPGKQIQQLNGQTQRLLGQQSLAEYSGMCVDVDRIRADNDAKQAGSGPTQVIPTWYLEHAQSRQSCSS